jgi:hypothetical protein
MTANGYVGQGPISIGEVTGLQAALDAKLDEVAPVVTDSTFTVVRTAGGAARWRSTGGALDIDMVGDVIESSFANQDFTGTQTGLRRMRAASGNTLVGLTEFGSTAYAAEQSIDSRTGQGVAYLGAKNGAVNVGICGFLDMDGPPTTGTWAVNDLIRTRTGAYRCTVAGTPGTWSGTTLSLTEVATPPPAIPDQLTLYAIDQDGNTVARLTTPEGITLDPLRDVSSIVRNASGGTIAKGAPVHASGVHPGGGSITTVAGARADAATTLPAIGVMMESTANNTYGRMLVAGRLEDVDTSAFSVGDILYLSSTVAGGYTLTPPAHPFYQQPIAQVLRAHASTGILFIRIGAVRGIEIGTTSSTFAVGNNTAGTKTVQFKNGFTGSLSATPTATRTWTLPDLSGTLALTSDNPMPTPLDHNLIGWTFDPIDQQAGTVVPTAGLAHVVRIRALSSVITNIHVHVTVAGSALTANQCYMAVYNDAGALLGAGAITASLHSTGTNGWGDTGAKVHPLVTPQAVTPGAWYKVLFWFNGTTGPTISRNTNAGSAMLNIGLTAGTARYATANSGLTTAGTVPANIGATSGGSTAWWVGLS